MIATPASTRRAVKRSSFRMRVPTTREARPKQRGSKSRWLRSPDQHLRADVFGSHRTFGAPASDVI
jgi:hypothetical protein